MKGAYILDILRTPIGKYGGALSSVRPDDLAALVIKNLFVRNSSVDRSIVEDVIFGAANQAGEDNRNVARMALLLAGLPVSVAGQTVNRLCASGLQAIIDAAQSVGSGNGNILVAGGVESMSRAPFVVGKSVQAFSRNVEMHDTTMGWRFVNEKLSSLYHPFSMGETAENVAEKYNVTREQQDQFALQSQLHYSLAAKEGKFHDELIAVPTANGIIDKDEHPRETSIEKLASLSPVFRNNGTVTAGNSSGINDGAAACLVVSEDFLTDSGLSPMVRVASIAVAGVDPSEMGIGPVPATQRALKRAGLTIQDIGLIELNEAFASQSIACIRLLGLDPSAVNVNGGAIALGHPLGCSGVRISATLIHEMKKRKVRYGLATMCVGVGQGVAVIFENTMN
jgi:3-oxoadipyl-CoA thiolase